MMDTAKKIKYYIKAYIYDNEGVRNMVVPVVIALIMATYFDVHCSAISSQMTTKAKEEDDAGKLTLLKSFVLYFFMEYTLKFFVALFNVNFVATSMQAGFTNFFKEYLMIKYGSFHRIGVGEAQYNIVRRSTALADFLTSFTMYFMANAFFFIVAIHTSVAGIPFETKLLVLGFIMAFLCLSTCLQYLRSKVRRRVNNGFQTNSKKLYDILLNYERIVAYDNIDAECNKYWDSMNNQVFYSVIYWVTYEIADALNTVAFICLNVYLIRQFNSIDSFTGGSFQNFTVLFTKLGEKVFEISRNIDDIFVLFTNLDQSCISDFPMEKSDSLLRLNNFKEELKVEGLSFSHGDKLIFQNVNTTIKKGEMVAIIGVNGSGKSTFVKILLGLYDYDGTIKVDNQDYKELSRQAIRELINYIPQNSYLFDGTIMHNLTLGNKDLSHEKLVEYTRLYKTHGLFKELGYDKEVGERGKNLSGGQAQKVSFMRAVIKNSFIFILDEATSNMDTISELELIKSLREHATSKTIIMIIHNLSLLQHFEHVLFFNNKMLAEQGTFDDLYKSKDGFRQFYEESIVKE